VAACDPLRYKELGSADWETHGSCAENLVAALHELNKKVGLKGHNAIGSDVSVNRIPDPLNLFGNIPTVDGELSFSPPQRKRGDYARFRAERCNSGHELMSPGHYRNQQQKAHFVVESPSERAGKWPSSATKRPKKSWRRLVKERRPKENRLPLGHGLYLVNSKVLEEFQQNWTDRLLAIARPLELCRDGVDSSTRPKQPAPKAGRTDRKSWTGGHRQHHPLPKRE
jgi:hypothetical protein